MELRDVIVELLKAMVFTVGLTWAALPTLLEPAWSAREQWFVAMGVVIVGLMVGWEL